MQRNYYILLYSSYDETIQRKQSAQYRKRRAITVKVTLTSARCDTVFHIYTILYIIYIIYITIYIIIYSNMQRKSTSIRS